MNITMQENNNITISRSTIRKLPYKFTLLAKIIQIKAQIKSKGLWNKVMKPFKAFCKGKF